MTIETKRTIGDFVFIMHDNKPTRVEITGIYTTTTSATYPNTWVKYVLYGVPGDRDETDVFSTKEALLQSL